MPTLTNRWKDSSETCRKTISVRHIGIEVDDAIEIAEKIDI
jgi:hypothetical protein